MLYAEQSIAYMARNPDDSLTEGHEGSTADVAPMSLEPVCRVLAHMCSVLQVRSNAAGVVLVRMPCVTLRACCRELLRPTPLSWLPARHACPGSARHPAAAAAAVPPVQLLCITAHGTLRHTAPWPPRSHIMPSLGDP